MGDYVIVGDTKTYNDCLVYVCGSADVAEKTLDRMLNNPTEYDKELLKKHTNLRIDFVSEKNCWWKWNYD